MKKKTLDILIRAGKTFLQGFIGALAITLPNTDITDSTVKSLLIGAIASGVSAVMNLIIGLISPNEDEEVEE